MTNKSPIISIIIPHWNGIETLSECISSLFETNFNSYEIIIVDNNSSDETIDIVNNFKHDNRLKKDRFYTNVSIFNIDKYTPGKALNLGVKKSKFDH